MPSQKLTHAAFWDRMDRATRHVGKLPDWVKGTPSNERPASSVCDQCQTSAARSGSNSLFELFPDEETARTYLEGRLWPSGPTCPVCKCQDRITTRKGGFYRCNACQLDFTVRTGTIFGRSHIPLHKWIYAMYLLVTARKGISSLQLAKEIGVTQKSAWFMLQRLREACGSNITYAEVTA